MTTPTKLNRFTSGPLIAEMRERNSTITEAEAKLAIGRVFDSLASLIGKGEPVRIAGFGTFKRKLRAARNARNPQTGETLRTSEKHVIAFKQGKPA